MKVNTIEKFIEKAYTGGTILQIDAPGKFMFTIYKHFQKEAVEFRYDTGKFIRFWFFELDYSIKIN